MYPNKLFPRKPTAIDHARKISIYAGDDHDPDRYTIWYEGERRVVTRRPMETGTDLFKRVRDATLEMRMNDPDYPRFFATAFAHVYAGIDATEIEIREHESYIRVLHHIMLNGKSRETRASHGALLAKFIGIMVPPVVK